MSRDYDDLPTLPDNLLLAILEGDTEPTDEQIALIMEAQIIDAYNLGRMSGEKRAANLGFRNKFMDAIAKLIDSWIADATARAKAKNNRNAA